MRIKQSRDRIEVVVGRDQGLRRDRGGDAGAARYRQRRRARAGLHEQGVRMSVIPAFELDDQVAAGGGARDPQGTHRRLGPAVDEPDPLDRRHSCLDQLGEADLARAGDAERASRFGCVLDRLDNTSIGVAEQEWAERADVVDVPAPGVVPDERPLATHENRWLAADRSIRSDGAVHPTWKEVRGDRHSAPKRRVIASIGRWIPVIMGVSRTVERRLSVPRSSRTRSPKAARSSVSYATRKSMSSTPNE